MSEVLSSKCWEFENRHSADICSEQQPVFFTGEVRLIIVWKEGYNVLLLVLGLGRWFEMLDLVSINITPII